MTNREKALGIAARIWCDQDMQNVIMDAGACVEIAEIIERILDLDEELV